MALLLHVVVYVRATFDIIDVVPGCIKELVS